MGGIGSGRRSRYRTRDTTEDSRPLDIRKLQRNGLLQPGSSFSWQWTLNGRVYSSISARTEPGRVVLMYRSRDNGEGWQDVVQRIELTYTPCSLGGTRPWWVCPGCNRRVAIVYGAQKLYACRHCYQLAYTSQRETYDDRAARRADRIRKKLGWEVGILNGRGWKPKGMHWRTYYRLTDKHDAFVHVALEGFKRFLRMK